MSEKRFLYTGGRIWDKENDCKGLSPREIHNLLNKLNDENQALLKLQKENSEIKQLIHTMLVQIDIEKINTKNARYSARIIFTLEEFKKMRQIWKGDFE